MYGLCCMFFFISFYNLLKTLKNNNNNNRTHLGQVVYEIGSKSCLACGHGLLTPVLEFFNVMIITLFVLKRKKGKLQSERKNLGKSSDIVVRAQPQNCSILKLEICERVVIRGEMQLGRSLMSFIKYTFFPSTNPFKSSQLSFFCFSSFLSSQEIQKVLKPAQMNRQRQ